MKQAGRPRRTLSSSSVSEISLEEEVSEEVESDAVLVLWEIVAYLA